MHRAVLRSDALRVCVLEFGAVLQSIEVPDRHGTRANVVLGLDDLEGYVARSPHFGAVPGRYAGRIAQGRFTLDGVTYQLTRNQGQNTLHGGTRGFGKRPWTILHWAQDSVTLGLSSPDGEEGFPGNLRVRVRYSLLGPALRIDFTAETDRPTILNLTNHSYFNLAGEGSGDVFGHELTIDSDTVLPVHPDGIPTGERCDVIGTPFDFRVAQPIGRHIRDAHPQIVAGLGYDHPYLIRGTGLRRAARLHDPVSGRILTVRTTEPALQLYTANTLTGTLAGTSGRVYRQSDGVCLEAQHPPDSPNQPTFPTTVLRPAEPFAATTIFDFDPEPA